MDSRVIHVVPKMFCEEFDILHSKKVAYRVQCFKLAYFYSTWMVVFDLDPSIKSLILYVGFANEERP